MKALILSGGSGTRLRPITFSSPKQLLPIANKPIIFYLIEKIANAGIRDIGIIVGDTSDEIMAAIGNGQKWNVNITYIHQSYPLGLAHAVKTAQDFIENSKFIMLLGDNLFSMELGPIIQNFDSSSFNSSLLLHKLEDPSGFGVAEVKNKKIVRLLEKPANYVSNLIITGVYLFDKNIFPAIDQITPSKRGELEITDAIQSMLENGKNISFEITEGWWKDTGTLKDLLKANELVLSGPVKHEAVIKNNVIENSTISNYVIIGKNCRLLNSYIGPYTSIGDNTFINNCSIENSILLEGSRLKDIKGKISSSLIGKNSRITGLKKQSPDISFFVGDNTEIYL